MIALETRTFEARFGERCPFCNKSWGDPSPCGDSRADRTIRDGLRLLFSDRVAECDVCGKQMPQGRKRCYECAQPVIAYRAKEDRHRRVPGGNCEVCGKAFTIRSDKRGRGQTVCSRSCALRRRHAA